MQIRTCLRAGVTATGIAIAGITATATATAAPATPSPATATPEVRSAAPVPPGGLVTSFLDNQLIYCSIICPLVARTGTTAVATTSQAPATYRTALQSEDPIQAIGVTAASITGPTDAAAEQAIRADGTIVAPRALNAFEVGVVGLLDIGPAAAGGPPAIAAAVQTARQNTYTALNAPIVPDPTPTVRPQGLTQVVVVGAIDVVAAVAFPAFNDVLSGAFQTSDAAARELAATGDPARAAAAGADTVTAVQTAATTVVTNTIADTAGKIRAAAG